MKKTTKPINTFSIVGYDPATGESGVAVASKFLAAAAVVPWARAGAGAIATQSWANLEYGTKGLELLAAGMSAQEVLDELVAADEGRAVRQVGIVDERGGSASFTGDDCYDWAGGITGANFACQGNILVSEETVQTMAQTFQETEGDLADRLVAALLAGDNAGGDNRGKQSAGLLIVKEAGGYGGVTDKYIDLRVDDHKEPVRELSRILELHKLYFKKSDPVDILKIEGEVKKTITIILTSLGYLKEEQPTNEEIVEALKSFHLIENFDERVQEPGLVDKKVIEFMKQLVKETDL
jgi:uncharacterized Ntn-hydrolase superfamily protein